MIDPTPLALDFLPNALWESTLGWVFLYSFTLGVIGALSSSIAIGGLAAYSQFAYFAISIDNALVTDVFYATLVLVVIALGFKLWRLEGAGG